MQMPKKQGWAKKQPKKTVDLFLFLFLKGGIVENYKAIKRNDCEISS